MITNEMIEAAARKIDPEVWANELPVPTRADVLGFHERRQKSCAAAEYALTAALALIPGEPICHLVWKQARIAIDDVQDYYEVARPGDQSVDGSDPFPVYAAPALLSVAVKALKEIASADPNHVNAFDRLRMFATDDKTFSFTIHDANEIVEVLDDLLSSPVGGTEEDCRHCKGKGCQPGDPEGDPLEACDYCGGSGKSAPAASDTAALREENERLRGLLHRSQRSINEAAISWASPDKPGLWPSRASVLLDEIRSALQHIAKGER